MGGRNKVNKRRGASRFAKNRMNSQIKLSLSVLTTLFIVCGGCSKETLSERDLAREQARARADIKRFELDSIAGIYNGELTEASESTLNALLNLEAKDTPTPVDGQVDPILVPALTGYLRVIVGSGLAEHVNYSVTRSEYDPSKKKLTFVASNTQFKDMYFSLDSENHRLSGSWNAPEAGTTGTATFLKKNPKPGNKE